MKIYEFIRNTIPTGGSLIGKELEPYQGKMVFLDELDDREIVFMDSDWIEDEDGTVIKVQDVVIPISYDSDIPNINIEKLFDEVGIVYLYGFIYEPSSSLTIRYVIHRPDVTRVKMFSGYFNSIQTEVNTFLNKISKKFVVENVLQSSSGYANGVVISIWYRKR